jgi:Zn-finger nucleic acid-binding protein
VSMVRFATICDSCGQRSEEYTHWLECKECGLDVCPRCRETDFDDDERGKSLCKECYQEALASNEDEEVDRLLQQEMEERKAGE